MEVCVIWYHIMNMTGAHPLTPMVTYSIDTNYRGHFRTQITEWDFWDFWNPTFFLMVFLDFQADLSGISGVWGISWGFPKFSNAFKSIKSYQMFKKVPHEMHYCTLNHDWNTFRQKILNGLTIWVLFRPTHFQK